MIDKKFLAVKKYLKTKKEKVIFDLIIKDYDKSNFYMALVFNKKIEKFKVLFIPIDVMETNKTEEYCCYQFIDVATVNYFFKTLRDHEEIYKEASFRNKLSKTMNAYYIEINIFLGKNNYQFLTNQIIPQEWNFLFDIIVTLFEYSPNIISELCNKILALFNDSFGHIKYDYSFDINLEKDNLGLFSYEDIKLGEEIFSSITYAEKNQDKYIVLIKDNIYIFTIDPQKGIFNVYVDNKVLEKEHLYALYCVFKNNLHKKFIKLIQNENKYLCFGIENDNLLVLNKYIKEKIAIEDFFKNDFKVLDVNSKFLEKLKPSLEKFFTKKEVNKFLEKIKQENEN